MLCFRYGIALPALSVLLACPAAIYAQADAGADARIQADVQKALDHSRFSGVRVTVNHGVVTLSGQVGRYADKEDADNKAHHRKDVVAVRNQIEVAGGEATNDEALREKLSKKLVYDRVGYGTTAFNNITLQVQNGVVTIGGTVYGPADKDSALSLVANTEGVRDVIDNLEVAPVSPMDDRIREAEFRAIYGFPSLSRYAIDPAKNIRITVVNGHVTLNGVVDSKADRDTAGIRANSVPGVFSVNNQLQVAGQRTDR
ncbi:MAG TPA: BON domain-containing protein [Acidobacteriaceae bacterium]